MKLPFEPSRTPVLTPLAAICAAVTPPVYFGRFAMKFARWVTSRPKMNISTKHVTPNAASAGDDLVERPRR